MHIIFKERKQFYHFFSHFYNLFNEQNLTFVFEFQNENILISSLVDLE